jgi:hypothetical protein
MTDEPQPTPLSTDDRPVGAQVKVKVRPGQSLRFPAICVNCSAPASHAMRLRRRVGRATRLIDVPLCAECWRQTVLLSAEEERLDRVGKLASAAAVVPAVLLFLLLGGILPLALSAALCLLLAGLSAAGVAALFRRRRAAAARPEKRLILDSAEMAAFSWRATTFAFRNPLFARRFAELNAPSLMNVDHPSIGGT